MASSTVKEATTDHQSLPRRIGYRILLGLPALAAALFGGHLLVTGWFNGLDGGSHRFHDLTWGVLEGVIILVGLLGALWRPTRHPAAYQQAVVGFAALLVTMVLIRMPDPATLVVGALIVAGGFLHPARAQLRRVGPWHTPTLLVAAVTAAPLLWYALEQAALQRTGSMSDPHVNMAHYAGAAAVALGLAGIAVLSASGRPGRRLVAGSTVAGLAVLGVASLVWPDLPSSFGTVGGAAALLAAAALAVTTTLATRDGATTRRTSMSATALLVVAIVATGCAADQEATDDTASGGDAAAAASTIEVTGTDYAFEGLPADLSAGTTLGFTNGSDAEVHEMLLLRVDDDETRPLEELMELPDEEAQQVTEFTGMLLALPGEDGVNPENPSTQTLTIDQPGRYVLLCFIPEGANVEAYRSALEGQSDGPPEVEGGPPHAALGMVAEVTVAE